MRLARFVLPALPLLAGITVTATPGTAWSSSGEAARPLVPAVSPQVAALAVSNHDCAARGRSVDTTSLAIFYRRRDGTAHGRITTPAGVREVNLGGQLAGGPAAVAQWCLDNGYQVSVRGTDNALWDRTVNDAGALGPGWEGLGGVLGAEPSVSVNPESNPPVGLPPDTQVHALVRGVDGHLWYKTQEIFCRVTSCVPSQWTDLGGALLDRPGATVNPNSYRGVFVRGVDNALWAKFGPSSGAWGGWVPLGGILTAGPAGGFEQLSDASYRFFAVVRGSDGHAWRIVNVAPGSWRWEDLGGLLASAPSVTVRQSSGGPFPEIYVVGTDGWVYVNRAAPVGGAFQGWRRVFLPS